MPVRAWALALFSSCGKQGKCQILSNPDTGVCICDDGYEQDPTLSVGACLNATTGGFFACECEPGYVGPQCNGAQPNPCDQAPCQNGATCIALPELDTKFLCKCPNGFEGDLCEKTVEYGIGGAGYAMSNSAFLVGWVYVIFALIALVYCTIITVLQYIRGRLLKNIKAMAPAQ